MPAAGWSTPPAGAARLRCTDSGSWRLSPPGSGCNRSRTPPASATACSSRSAKYWPIYLIVIAFAIGLFMPGIQGPFLLESVAVTSATKQGLIVSASSVAAVLAAASYGWLARRLSQRGQLAFVAACLGAGSLVNGFAGGIPAMALGCAITGMGGGLNEPVLVSVLFSRAPDSMRTRAIGLLLSAIFLGQFLNPLTVDPLRQHFGIHGAFLSIGGLLLLLAILLAARRRPGF